MLEVLQIDMEKSVVKNKNVLTRLFCIQNPISWTVPPSQLKLFTLITIILCVQILQIVKVVPTMENLHWKKFGLLMVILKKEF